MATHDFDRSTPSFKLGMIALLTSLTWMGCRDQRIEAPRDTLGPATAVLTQTFTALTSVRELADGRVLLSDPREARLVVASFVDQAVKPVAKPGRGPGEYVSALPFFPIADDSSISVDGLAKRWLILHGDTVVATRTISDPAVAAVRFPYGFDEHGFALSSALRSPDTGGSRTRSDSTPMVLVARDAGSNIFVTALQSAPPPAPNLPPPVLNPSELAVLAPDGWIAVVRLQPYRVDWRKPDGTWVFGKPLPIQKQRFDEAEKREYGGFDPRGVRAPAFTWPRELPPFVPGWIPIVSPDGNVLVRRARSAHFDGIVYDVIDRRGGLRKQLIVQKNERVLGFGPSSVYVVASDESDLETLRRHDWPIR